MDILSLSLVQISLLLLLDDFILFSLAFFHSLSFQRYESTCETFEKPVSWPLLWTLLLLSSSSQISHFSVIFFTSIVLSFFGFFFSFIFCSFFSCFFSFSSFLSSSFCFYHSNFYCFGLHSFLHFSGYLITFTSPVLQSISGLWQASHNISKLYSTSAL